MGGGVMPGCGGMVSGCGAMVLGCGVVTTPQYCGNIVAYSRGAGGPVGV